MTYLLSQLYGQGDLLIAIIGAIVVILSLLAKLTLAGQVRLNARRRSVDGLSISFYLVALASYLSYAIYGIAQHNWIIILAQAPGAILMAFIGVQWWRYRKPPA